VRSDESLRPGNCQADFFDRKRIAIMFSITLTRRTFLNNLIVSFLLVGIETVTSQDSNIFNNGQAKPGSEGT
jgi:hypothetical protein